MPDLNPGITFAGHRIEGIAGRGGMGTVYRATHLALDHVVALKVISPDLAADEGFRERFRSESRVAVSLRHPNVVPIHHAGEEDGLLFVTMDLIDGPDLRRLLISGGVLEPERAASLIGQVASALDVAHSRGLVHRDIKPGNILVEQRPERAGGEHAYLTDFGLAKRFDQATQASGLTGTGAFVGTLDYVAPEQIRGDRVDARTDVYALGCVLYEVMAGRPPFGEREENVAKIYAHLQDEPPWLPGDIDDELDEVIARAMAKEPAERFPSAGDLARAADAAASGAQPRAAERSVATGKAAPVTPAETIAVPEPADTMPSEPAPPAEPPPTEPNEPPTEQAPEPQPRRGGGGGPSGGVLLGSLAALAALVVAAVLLLGGGDDESPGGGTEASTQDATGGEERLPAQTFGAPISVDGFPLGLTIHNRQVSIATREGGQLVTISKETREPVDEPIDLGGDGEGVVTLGEFAWVTLPQDDAVAKVSLDDREVVGRIAVGDEPRGIAVSGDAIWVANLASSEISRIDPVDDDVETTTLKGAAEPTDIAFDDGSTWVSDRANGQVIKVDAVDQTPYRVGANPKGIVVSQGVVWVANTEDGTVSRLTTAGERRPDVDVEGTPRGVAAGLGYIWVANGDGYVSAIDPKTGQEQRVELPGSPEEVAVGPERIWVTTGEGNELVSVDPPGGVE